MHLPCDPIDLPNHSIVRVSGRIRMPGRSGRHIKESDLACSKAAGIGNADRICPLLSIGGQVPRSRAIGASPACRTDDDNRLGIITVGAWIDWLEYVAADRRCRSTVRTVCLFQKSDAGAR